MTLQSHQMQCVPRKHAACCCVALLLAFAGLAGGATLPRPGKTNTTRSADDAPLPTPTTAQVLLYIPFHVSEPDEHLVQFLDCTFRHRPTQHGLQFDVLLSISGLQLDGREERLRKMLRQRLASLAPTPQVYVHFTELTVDDYDILYTKQSANRLAGPNDAFYDALLDGAVYSKYIARYAFVQQLESDTCSVRHGWLDALLRPAQTNSAIIVSGATVKGNCLYDAKEDICQPLVGVPTFMTSHVNGNALYRVGTELTALLSLARTTFGNAEPFDTSLYKAAEMLGNEDSVYSNPSMYNMASLVDAAWFDDARYYGSSSPVAVVHAPRRLRTDSVRPVASRFRTNIPLTLIALSSHNIDAAKNLSQTLHDQGVNVAFVATDQPTYVRAVDVWPYQVIPAFASTRRSAQWPRSRLLSGLVLTAVSRLNQMQYSVFVLHPTFGVGTNYDALLYSLSPTSIHVGSNTLIHKRGLRDCLIGSAYIPGLVAYPFVDMWANQLVLGKCPSYNQLTAMAASAGLGDVVAKLSDGHIVVPPTATASPRPQPINLFVVCGVLALWILVCHLYICQGRGQTRHVNAAWARVVQARCQRGRTLQRCVSSE